MNDRERVVKGLECCTADNPTEKPGRDDLCKMCPYHNVKFSYCFEKGTLMKDALKLLNELKPHELTKAEWENWKKAKYRDPICMIYKQDDTRTPIWVMKPENVNEPAYLMGEIKLFTGKPDREDVKWE